MALTRVYGNHTGNELEMIARHVQTLETQPPLEVKSFYVDRNPRFAYRTITVGGF